MREKVKDVWRLQHILNSIQVLEENKGRYSFEEVAKWFRKTCGDYR